MRKPNHQESGEPLRITSISDIKPTKNNVLIPLDEGLIKYVRSLASDSATNPTTPTTSTPVNPTGVSHTPMSSARKQG